ncbi:hypothetical protein DITRI_Ditri16bG0050200 [Diplodiscus trichospermus]
MAGLPSKGHRRTQIWMVQGAYARQVPFSKNRSDLFKKASELCTLFAVKTILVVLSPGGQAFSCGHPGVDTIMNRLANCGKPDFDAIRHAEAEHEAILRQLKKEYFDLHEQVKAEKIRGERLKQMSMESQSQGQRLWARPIDELNSEELLTLESEMEELRGRLLKHFQERFVKPAASTPISVGQSNASLRDPTEGDSSAYPHDHDGGHKH